MSSDKMVIDRKALDGIDVPIFVKNINGIYIYCNKAFVKFLGLSEQKILGHSAFDISPVRLAEIYAEADRALFQSKDNQRYDARVLNSSNGETAVTFSKSLIYSPEYEVAGLIGSIDIPTNDRQSNLCLNSLTRREIDILNLLTKGKSVKVIASNLHISIHTVTSHLKAIYSKLDAHSKSEAVYKALLLLNAGASR